MWISDETFRKDIEWFSRRGELVDIKTILDTSMPDDRPLFSITFDDGWIDNYTYAYPLLKQNNVPATIFLVTNAVETGEIFWVEDFLYKIATLDSTVENPAKEVLDEQLRKASIPRDKGVTGASQLAELLAENLKTLPEPEREDVIGKVYTRLGLSTAPLKGHILNWDQVREMDSSGITFGSHTHNHVILQYANDNLAKDELENSRRILTERLGKVPEYFCYPNARYRTDNADILRSTGYRYAFRMHNLPLKKDYNEYFIPRYLLNEYLCSNRNILKCKLLGIPGFR
jgi:peptidoglycan/xylan/chitin deacetylase (PgdA/CDA1 family)